MGAHESHEADPMARRLARWSQDFAGEALSEAALFRTKLILLDSLACGLASLGDETSRQSLQLTSSLGGAPACSVIGTALRTSLPWASFANCVLIRSFDLNDSYAGPGYVGHPSDVIGVALAAAEQEGRSGTELLQAIRLGYEVYCRLLDLMNPDTCAWDHTCAGGIASAVLCGWQMGLDEKRLAETWTLAATHCLASREIRGSNISKAKTTAAAVVAQTGVLASLMAREGLTGPSSVFDGPRGFAKTVLQTETLAKLLDIGAPRDRLFTNGFKLYPCFAIGQGPIHAAIRLHRDYELRADMIDHIRIDLANTAPARLRLADPEGRRPGSREAADHSIYALVSIALLDGAMTDSQMASARWSDEDVLATIGKMTVEIDPAMDKGPPGAFPCRIQVRLKDGREACVHQAASPGHHTGSLSWEDVAEKFCIHAAPVLGSNGAEAVLHEVSRIEAAASVSTLIKTLTCN